MEVRKSLNDLLDTRAICGFEMANKPFSAFFGAEPNHPFVEDMQKFYDEKPEYQLVISTETFNNILINKYGADPSKDIIQNLKEGITLYPSNYFSANIPANYVVHYYEGNWLAEHKHFYSQLVNSYAIVKQFIENKDSKTTINHLVHHNKIFNEDMILDQIPLKYIVNYCKKKLLKKIGF